MLNSGKVQLKYRPGTANPVFFVSDTEGTKYVFKAIENDSDVFAECLAPLLLENINRNAPVCRSPACRIVRGVSVKLSTPRRSPTGRILRDAAGNTIMDEVPARVNGVLTNTPVGPYGTFSVPLNAFADASNLVSGSTYHWRVSARDNRGMWSDWPPGDYVFQFGVPLEPVHFARIWKTADRNIVIEWEPSPNNIYVEFSTNLQSGSWTNIAGPLTGTSWTNAVDPGKPSGFYRLRSK